MAARGDSAPVRSKQAAIHRDLFDVVKKHVESPYARPIADHSRTTFAELERHRVSDLRSIVVDAGCGTADSTARLALRHPRQLVIGIDKSAKRLARACDRHNPRNAVIVRGDLVDLWRLMAAKRWRVDKHYLLYPNPWPKPKHLKRRWHAHPVFPVMLGVSVTLELRTNWLVYAEEFCAAAEYLSCTAVDLERIHVVDALSPFEKKYQHSGHPLFKVTVAR